ncbi:hypothetical protein [Burkholderia cepacia]|uniref:hypothetical protein n=1 Tax=Burkholderia cepacia TaxID=292 RepID=UPI002FDF7B60
MSTGEFVPRPDIIYRTLVLIRSVTDVRRRLKQLEEETGIPDRQWKHVWALKQRPTAHMLEALARRWPEYAFWLVTGLTDAANGHVSPTVHVTSGASALDKNVKDAREYFEHELLYQEVGGVSDGATPEALNAQPVDELTRLLLEDTAEVPAGQDEDLWEKYLAFLTKQQDETKALDEAIAKIAKDRRIQALAERCGLDLSSHELTVDVWVAYSTAHGNRKARLKKNTKNDSRER